MDTGTNFAAILRALRTDSDNNIIATPQIVTMDNQEAEIKVAQEVPFLTGQYANTGSAVPGVNPFQTIQREEVGNILKITPSIASEGDLVILKIQQEASNVAANSFNAVDLVTNKRTITTNVLIEDGGIIVLGGLISDQVTGSEQRVPILGHIPAHRRALQGSQYAEAQEQPHVLHPPEDSSRRRPDGDRDQLQVQQPARPAAQAAQRQGPAAAV